MPDIAGGIVLGVLALVRAAQPALAAPPNVPGSVPPAVPGRHSLTAVPTGGTTVLYAPSESDDPAFRAAVAAITGGTVDYFDAISATPSPATLASYDCVFTFTDFAYDDEVVFGNRLADYADAGGRVVLGVFTTYTQGNFLGGRIMQPGYSPVVGGDNRLTSSDYAGDGLTSIYDQVSAFECSFRDILSPQGGGTPDGSYLDGEIAHAFNTTRNVVYSNGTGAVQLGCTGDWARLVANACAGVLDREFSLDDIVPAIGGQSNDWLISGATPGGTVTVLCRPQGGDTIASVGSATADASGNAIVRRTVPDKASGRTLQCMAKDDVTDARDTIAKAFS